MDEKKSLSETLRIDLIPGAAEPRAKPPTPTPAAPAAAPTPAPPSHTGRLRQPEEPAAVTRSRYQELLQSIYDAAIVTNVFGKITDANNRAAEFLQYSREELCSLQVFDIISGADKLLLQTLCEALQNQQFTLIQAYCRRRDDTFFPAEIAVNMLRFGQIYLCFFIRDITLRKQAEDRLRIEHDALHNAAAGIVIADLQARLEYANPAFASLVGLKNAEEASGRDFADFSASPETVDGILSSLATERGSWEGLLPLKASDGRLKTIRASAVCGLDSEGEPASIIFSFLEAASPAPGGLAAGEADALRARLQELEKALADARREIESLRGG